MTSHRGSAFRGVALSESWRSTMLPLIWNSNKYSSSGFKVKVTSRSWSLRRFTWIDLRQMQSGSHICFTEQFDSRVSFETRLCQLLTCHWCLRVLEIPTRELSFTYMLLIYLICCDKTSFNIYIPTYHIIFICTCVHKVCLIVNNMACHVIFPLCLVHRPRVRLAIPSCTGRCLVGPGCLSVNPQGLKLQPAIVKHRRGELHQDFEKYFLAVHNPKEPCNGEEGEDLSKR